MIVPRCPRRPGRGQYAPRIFESPEQPAPRLSRRRVLLGRLKQPSAYLEPLVHGGLALARGAGAHVLRLDFPPSADPLPRWGHGRPPHARLLELLRAAEPDFRASLEVVARHADALRAIPLGPAGAGEPYWHTDWLPGLDAAALYAFVREGAPRRYVEIGSGSSTAFAARAVRDGGHATEIVSVDPSPRAEVDALCDRVVRAPLERADLSLFAELDAGDVVFFDGSHRAFAGSDATVFFLEVLPELPSGVLVGVHDVFLPADYPPSWRGRWYSEQYLLAAYLLGGARVLPVLAAYYVSGSAHLRAVLAPLWRDLPGVHPLGTSFWLRSAGEARGDALGAG